MPKTGKQIIAEGSNKLGMSSKISESINRTANQYRDQLDFYNTMMNIDIDFLSMMKSDDEKEIDKALEKVGDFKDFLHQKFNGKTGYEILTEHMGEGSKEDFDECLRDFDQIYDLDLELDTLYGITPPKSAVVNTSFNDIANDIKTRPNAVLIPYKEDARLLISLNINGKKKDCDATELCEIIEPHLHTNAQKNVLRAYINSFYPHEKGTNIYEGSGIKDNSVKFLFNGLLNKTIYPNAFAKQFAKEAQDIISSNKKKGLPTNNLEIMIKNGIPEAKNEKKVIQDAPKKKQSSKKAVKEATLNYTSTPELPNFSDPDTRSWLKKLGARAESTQGRLFDSDKYIEFRDNAKILSDLAEGMSKIEFDGNKLYAMSRFGKNAAKLFAPDSNGWVNSEAVARAYKKAWDNLVKSAKEYEQFKIETEGFTRDTGDRTRHQLRSRSKGKFALMDEIFNPGKRKVDQMIKQ